MANTAVARLGRGQLSLFINTHHDKSRAAQQRIVSDGFQGGTLCVNGIFTISGTLGAGADFVGGHGQQNATTTINKCNMKTRTDGNSNTGSMLAGNLFIVTKFGHFFDIIGTIPIYSKEFINFFVIISADGSFAFSSWKIGEAQGCQNKD